MRRRQGPSFLHFLFRCIGNEVDCRYAVAIKVESDLLGIGDDGDLGLREEGCACPATFPEESFHNVIPNHSEEPKGIRSTNRYTPGSPLPSV